MKRQLLLVICAVILTPCLINAQGAKPAWKAGTARIVITPEKNLWMAGYAARTKPADGKFHDLYAKALAIADGRGNRAVIVTTDLLGIPGALAAAVAAAVEKKHQLPRASLALTSSHTHTGPVIRASLMGAYALGAGHVADIDEYSRQLLEKLVTVIGQALADMRPAVLSFGRGEARFGANRRKREIAPKDDDVPALRVDGADGKLRAALFSYACHNTTLTGEFYQYSGDYAGFAQAEFEKANPGAMALFMMGCGADINPDPRSSLDLATRHGNELAAAVNKTINGQLTPVRGALKTAFAQIPLQIAAPTRAEFQTRVEDKDKYRRAHAIRWLERMDRDGKIMTEYPYPVQVMQLGDGLTLVTLGGEVVVDYALRLKRELGADGLWVAGYSNDVMAYIPSVRILNEGGYEAEGAMIYYDLPGPWKPEVEERIIDKVRELARKTGRKGSVK
ncbi:MAG: neutral/alkaline non-lysosomal ceramidase N-terminal domain-containing protein [Blastocatellia bacterium]